MEKTPVDLDLFERWIAIFIHPKHRKGLAECMAYYTNDPHDNILSGIQHVINASKKDNLHEARGWVSGTVLGFLLAQHYECKGIRSIMQDMIDWGTQQDNKSVIDFDFERRKRGK